MHLFCITEINGKKIKVFSKFLRQIFDSRISNNLTIRFSYPLITIM